MDPATSFRTPFIRRPLGILIDRTLPFVEVDISRDGSFKKPGTDQPPEVNVSGSSPPPPPPTRAPFPPQSTHTLLDIPISSSKALRIGCWPESPIDSDALVEANISFNIRKTLESKSVSVRPEFNKAKSGGGQTRAEVEPFKTSGVKCRGVTKEEIDTVLKLIEMEKELAKSGGGQTRAEAAPFITSGVKCSDITKEEIDTVLKLIEREKKLGRLPLQKCSPGDGIRYRSTNRTLNVAALKKQLKDSELTFKSQYSYDMMEYRHCITTNNSFCWKQESSGIMWVGVYGIDDVCVVTLSEQDVDGKRLHGCLASFGTEYLLSLFRKCVLSELEDLADPPCKFSEEFDGCFDPPFCIVPEISSFDNAPEEARSFLQQSGLLQQAKDSGDAIKLAISAFQRLVRKKFEAKEIKVTVLIGRKFGAAYTRDLKIGEIEDYLAAVEAFGY